MPKTRQEKEGAIADLITGLSEATAAVFANFQGLKVKESDELRAACRKENIRYVASKKTLLQKALTDRGYAIESKTFEGGVAAVFGVGDEIAPAKLIAHFAKTHEVVRIFGGILEGVFIDADKVKALAAIPSRQELYAKIAGSLNAPISGFARVLAGNLQGLATVLNKIREQKIA